ncbi:MAG TPA: 4Fe-4S dicluster domain-containing protein, partial [Thermoanaerobaculia bacterium]|nr:4Fe-4S dicluster domain-containing protein [Thermoanaerobaculia bacterium]
AGVYAVTQPAVEPLRNTRPVIESFATWSGTPARAYDLVRATGRTAEWDRTLHDGFATLPVTPLSASAARRTTPNAPPRPPASGLSLVLYPSMAMFDGRHAHNAWLHELPDPISKVTWDNCAALSPDTAKRLGVRDGDVVRISAGGDAVELPAFVQPGQHDDVVAIALGYGRAGTERFAKIGPKWLLRRAHLAPGEPVGKRVIQLARYSAVSIAATGRRHELATTQLHGRIDPGRPSPVREASADGHAEAPHHDASLWPEKPEGQRWTMAIDLTKCTGCSACIIGCQSENNVPVVGKDEVLREREMHWIRIDRYYSGEGDDLRVAHQPMMCAHCANAPCETVCPVLATVHSADGLNQQVYNRCVGTRYCANNCPYKVRRFNWFDYPHEDRFANLVLNPDVTVRSRGVMEKCSMCVQRIEEARIAAKQRGEPIADGAIRTACEQSCPADAIVFGDRHDPKSRVAALVRDKRHYVVLEELNIKPSVGYLELVRNV